MNPCTCGASKWVSAASTVGENFSGLLSCAMIMVTSARISLLVSPRARRRSSVPCTASRSSLPIASIMSGERLFTDGVPGMPAPCRKALSSASSRGPVGAPATFCSGGAGVGRDGFRTLRRGGLEREDRLRARPRPLHRAQQIRERIRNLRRRLGSGGRGRGGAERRQGHLEQVIADLDLIAVAEPCLAAGAQ